MDDRTEIICDLLLGAAYSDQEFHEREKEVILEYLGKLLGEDTIPESVAARIEHFDPEGFDAAAIAKGLTADSEDDKLKVLEIIGAIHDADDEFSFDEDSYVRNVGEALGIDADKLKGLTIEYEVEDLRESFAKVSAQPPPIPKKEA